VIAAAGQYQGVPYRYGGLDRRGLDCSALIYLSFRDALGVEIPRTVQTLHAWVEPVPEDRLLPGDLVFFKTLGPLAGVSHAGIYTGGGRFIHAASEGPATGVLYSRLNEAYWQRTYAGAGRVLPGEDGIFPPAPGSGPPEKDEAPPERGGASRGPSFTLALAASWNPITDLGAPFRGALLEVRGAYDFDSPANFRVGLELRPHWDALLGVLRIPLTLSLGLGDLVRVFAGPALTLGDPVSPGGRRYTGAPAWLGTIGITTAPFSTELGGGTLALYGEVAWEALYRDGALQPHWDTDLAAALRISTGLRYTWGR
jgi:probable lipoprotein NlpC